jgi:hypothetical protein
MEYFITLSPLKVLHKSDGASEFVTTEELNF